jgi:hypothetical protein
VDRPRTLAGAEVVVISQRLRPRWWGLWQTALLPARRAVLRRRVGRLVTESVEGIDLVVLPDVFNPRVFGSSNCLVRAVRQAAPSAARCSKRHGHRVNAIAAAMLGSDVVATDINPAAVRCART